MRNRTGIVSIVLARGGSKGIPRKNLVPLAGKSLITYTLEQARAVPAISRIIVSTDSDEIADVSRKCGAQIVQRPAELSHDLASSESAMLHCLDYLRDAESFEPDLVVLLQPTSPLRLPVHIEEAIETLEREEADSLFSAGPLIGLAWRLEGGKPVPISYDPYHRARRQDRPEYVAENGSIFVFKPWVLRELGSRLGGKIAVYRMSALDSFEVDEPEDIPLVEFLLRHRYPEIVKA